MIKKIGFVLSLGLLCSVAMDVQAAEPRLVGTFGDWSAYIYMEDGNKVCYMASKPLKHEGAYSKRGDIFALITNRPKEGTKDVFSYVAGYDYKEGSDVTVTIDDHTFTLFTQGDTAWASDTETDRKIADAIKSGSEMVVQGSSSRGTKTKDTFGLKGSSAAHDKIRSECN